MALFFQIGRKCLISDEIHNRFISDEIHSDEIHNRFIKCFNEETLEEIRRFFNFSYEMGIDPERWKEGLMISILKPYGY